MITKKHIFKIRKYFESYSRKKGMVKKTFTFTEVFDSYDEAVYFIKSKNTDAEIISEVNSLVETKFFTSSGVPIFEQYKIYIMLVLMIMFCGMKMMHQKEFILK